jgi:hypothetical protein
MYELFVTIGGKIITWILPYLIKKADKYVPIFLDDLINKRENGVVNKMATLKITVESDATTPELITGATLSTTINGTVVTYTTDATGTIEKSGFTSGESYTFTAVATGYATNTVTIVASDDGIVSGIIKLVAETVAGVTSAVESVVSKVSDAVKTAETSTTTVSEDWKTIKATAESAINGLSTSLTTSDLTKDGVVESLYSQLTTVINSSITKIDAYKSQLMISRHTKNFWECVLIDAKLSGIELFEYFVAKEISAIKTKITDKLSSLTK